MLKHSASIVIERPSEQVFALLSDLEKAPQWQSGVTQSRIISGGAVRMGTQFSETIKVISKPIEAICEVVEFEPGKKIGFRSDSAPSIQFEGHYTFETIPNGTRLSFTGWTRLGGFWRLVEPLFGGEVKKELASELQRIKHIMEAQP